MTWPEIKESIQNDLLNRGLKNPKIRLRALDRIELILKDNVGMSLRNPVKEFNEINKDELKANIAQYKPNGKLNGAESSVINEIYYRV
jgi:hypothetical protein